MRNKEGASIMNNRVSGSRAAKVTVSGVVFGLLISFVLIQQIMPMAAAQTYPTVDLTIVRIQEVDPIDGFGGDWDWFYWIGVYSGSTWSWTSYDAPNGQDVIVNDLHSYQVQDTTFSFAITLCEGDFWTNDDVADISDDIDGGYDDSSSNCNPTAYSPPIPFGGSYRGTWHLTTGTLTGDFVVQEPQGYKTSGDFDGNSGDENDANLWFTISDNYSPPTADAGPSKSGHADESISFDASGSTASSGSSIVEYAWDYNNDGLYDATGKIVTTTFSSKGTHTVRLRVTDSIGVQDTDTTTVNIINEDPIAAFTSSPSSPLTSEDIEFIETSSDPDGTIASWHWNFGDGTTSTSRNPTHSYDDDGRYTVVLTVTDNDGGQDSKSKSITVQNREPVADFGCTPSDPSTADTVQFTDSSSDDDGTIEAWDWDFGDGYTSENQNPTHSYSQAGTFTVELTVTDDDGDQDTVSLQITVAEAGIIDIAGGSVLLWIIIIIVIAVIISIAALIISRKKRQVQPPSQIPPEQPPPVQ